MRKWYIVALIVLLTTSCLIGCSSGGKKVEYATQVQLNLLKKDVDQLSEKVSNIPQDSVSQATQQATDVEKLRDRVFNLENLLNSLKGDSGGSEDGLSVLEQRLTDIEQRLTTLETAKTNTSTVIGTTSQTINGLEVVFMKQSVTATINKPRDKTQLPLSVKITNVTDRTILKLDILGRVTFAMSNNPFEPGYPQINAADGLRYMTYLNGSSLEWEMYLTNKNRAISLAPGASITMRPSVVLKYQYEIITPATASISIDRIAYD